MDYKKMYEKMKQQNQKLKQKNTELENMKMIIQKQEMTGFSVEGMKKELENMSKDILVVKKIQKENEQLKQENEELKQENEKLKKENDFQCDVSFIQGFTAEEQIDPDTVWEYMKEWIRDDDGGKYREKVFNEFYADEYIIKNGEVVDLEDEEEESSLSESQDVGGLDTK